MTKRGKSFEIAVADIARQIDPHATVSQGVWVDGPDGRRELDVSINANFEGTPRKILIECKDYKKKLGIGFLDALHSKSLDLGFDFAILCCNKGFTSPAIRKAKRLGIGLVGLLQNQDGKVTYSVVDEVFTRILQYQSLVVWFEDPEWPQIVDVSPEAISYKGLPLGNWILNHAMKVVSFNPIVNGDVIHRVRFSSPQEFEIPGSRHSALEFAYRLSFTGSWSQHIVSMSATSGMYNWLRRRFIPARGGGSFSFHDIDPYKGKKIARPPKVELQPGDIRYGEFWMGLLLFKNFPTPGVDVPNFDDVVLNPQQLAFTIENISDENITSNA